jgi:hypothetical protein
MKSKSIGDETGDVRVSKREYVTPVYVPSVPGSFTNLTFALNPGLPSIFSFLSQIAANYDEYQMIQLVFSYEPVISSASTVGSMGSVLVAVNYNAGAEPFESFKQMVEYDGAVQSRVCDPILFGVECDPRKMANDAHLYVRSGAVPADEDIKTYDMGLFQVATSDVSNSFAVGDLLGHIFVEYTVQLAKPKLYASLGNTILMDYFFNAATAGFPIGTGYGASSKNTLGGKISGTSRYVFPDDFEGTVMIQFQAYGTGIDITGMTFLTTATCHSRSRIGNTGTSGSQLAELGTNASWTNVVTCTRALNADDNTVYPVIGASTTYTAFSWIVTQINPLCLGV